MAEPPQEDPVVEPGAALAVAAAILAKGFGGVVCTGGVYLPNQAIDGQFQQVLLFGSRFVAGHHPPHDGHHRCDSCSAAI